jgi:hypothetical protein
MNSQAISAEMDEATEDLRWLTKPLDSIDDLELDHLIEVATAMLDDDEDPINQWGTHIARNILRERLYDLEMEVLTREQDRLIVIRDQENLA